MLLLGFAALALATLLPVLNEPGWPVNHDNQFGLRTEIYARHLARWDLLPIWASVDASGFGSPMPLMYHKLFYLTAGAIRLAGTSLKAATASALIVFLCCGALGLYLTMRSLGASRLAGAVAGASLVTANYTVTNWLVRGAVAELSAAMLVPWCLLFFLDAIENRRLNSGLGISLGLMWLAHSVLAYYVGLLLGITWVALALFQKTDWSLLHPRIGWPAVTCFMLLTVPYLSTMAALRSGYSFDRILVMYRPQFQFRPFLSYLWERHWRFGQTASGFSTELDHAMLALLLTTLVAVAAGRSRACRQAEIARALLPFVILGGLGLVLQLPVSAPFYSWVPGAEYLQFPWRLLALVTPCLIVVAVFLSDSVLPNDARLFALGATVAWMIGGSGAFAPLTDPRISLDPPQFAGITFSGPGREYEPKAAPPVAQVSAHVSSRWASAGCAFTRLDTNQEVREVRFRTSCVRATELPLPIYATSLHRVTSSVARGQMCLAMVDAPTLCGSVIPGGHGIVTVELPSMSSALDSIWGKARRIGAGLSF